RDGVKRPTRPSHCNAELGGASSKTTEPVHWTSFGMGNGEHEDRVGVRLECEHIRESREGSSPYWNATGDVGPNRKRARLLGCPFECGRDLCDEIIAKPLASLIVPKAAARISSRASG